MPIAQEDFCTTEKTVYVAFFHDLFSLHFTNENKKNAKMQRKDNNII